MRKAKTAPKLPTRPDWFAALAAAGDVAYPKTDPVSGRPLSRPNTVTYAEVFERVMLGSAEYPGLLSPSFIGSGSLVDPDGGPGTSARTPQGGALRGPRQEAVVGPDQLGPPAPPRQGAVVGPDTSANLTVSTGGPGTSARVPQDTALSEDALRRYNIPTDRGFELGIDPYAGDRGVSAQTPQIPSFTAPPSSQMLPGSMPTLNRVQNLADSLMRNMYTETYTKVPLGFAQSDMAATSNPEAVKLDSEIAALQARINLLPEGSQERQILVNEGDALLVRRNNLPAEVFRFAPGRGPVTPAQRAYSDWLRQTQTSPEEYDPRRVFNVGSMLQRGMQETGETLFDDDIAPIVRSFFQNGELGSLKQRLINIDFIDDSQIRDMNAPDDATVTALSNLVAIAQRSGVTWEQELERLENDQDYMSRVAENRRGRGGAGIITYRLPSDDDLTAVFKAVSRSTIGRELPKEAYQSMIDAYKPLLLNYQRQLQGGGVVTEPPQAETFAATQIGEQFQDEEFTYGLGTQLNNFMQILGGAM
jgi:hypothetical protein